MKSRITLSGLCSVILCCCNFAGAAEPNAKDYWVEAMAKVHAQFTGEKGTFAHFGDSITFTMAYWAPLKWEAKNMSPQMEKARGLAHKYMKADCWDKWKGPAFGNESSMTIRWALQNVDAWLKKLNPEMAVIMFGSNDVGQMEVEEYEQKTRDVVRRCLKNGTIVILTTMPPRSGRAEKSKVFAEAVRKIAADEKVPLIDYYAEIMQRRPDDWDGSSAKFKTVPGDGYQVPTLISRDGVHPSNPKEFVGVYSEEALKNNGFVLRNYLTLLSYAEVLQKVMKQ